MLRACLLVALGAVGCTQPVPVVSVPAPIVIVQPPPSLGHIKQSKPAEPRLVALIAAYDAASDAGITFAMHPDTTAEQIGYLRDLDRAARSAVERCQARGKLATQAEIATASAAVKRLKLFVHEAPH